MDPHRVFSHSKAAAPAEGGLPPGRPEGLAKKPYHRPRLVLWGDLRDLTLGPSPGVGESGNPGMFKP